MPRTMCSGFGRTFLLCMLGGPANGRWARGASGTVVPGFAAIDLSFQKVLQAPCKDRK